MRRFAIVCTLLAATATGAWALPAGQADPVVETTPLPAAPAAPTVELPDISGAAERQAVPTTEAPAPAAAPAPVAPVHIDEPADHLVVEAPAATPEVVAVVTTTTAPPPPPTTTAPPAPKVTVAFTATQAYGSCGEDIPYDIFSGTATPGTTVTISSPYGSGSTTADANGHWERTVEFPSAPRNELFAVSLSGLGGSTSLNFMATGGSH